MSATFPWHTPHNFPNLDATQFTQTSNCDPAYNCIAWAANDTANWWWPDEDSYWPDPVPREETWESFTLAFQTLGYSACANGELVTGVEKIAIYGDRTGPLHTARQLPEGAWTSKIGREEDIRHESAECLCGKAYGDVLVFMSRPANQ